MGHLNTKQEEKILLAALLPAEPAWQPGACAGVRYRVFVGDAEEDLSLVRAFPLQSNPLVFLVGHFPGALPPQNHVPHCSAGFFAGLGCAPSHVDPMF